jgi:preprotein translocase subunit SecG
MFTLIITLILIVAVLLVLVILAQNSKGGGLSGQFGGSGTSQVMGVKRTADLLEKMTWTLAILLLALSLSTNLIVDTEGRQGPTSPNIERARETGTGLAPTTPQQQEGDQPMQEIPLEENEQ